MTDDLPADITIDPHSLSPFLPPLYPAAPDPAVVLDPMAGCVWRGQSITFRNTDADHAVVFKAPPDLFDLKNAVESTSDYALFSVPACETVTLSVVASPAHLTCYSLQLWTSGDQAGRRDRGDAPDPQDGKINVGTKPTY